MGADRSLPGEAFAIALVNRDDRKLSKCAADAVYRVTDWLSASLRYDRVVLDVDHSANSFGILSPRLAFFASVFTREMLRIDPHPGPRAGPLDRQRRVDKHPTHPWSRLQSSA